MRKQAKHPQVSVIIVNYNGKGILNNCLKSLFSQSYKNFEVILVDNASQDKSAEKAILQYPKIKLLKNKKNFGFAKACNLGLSVAKGKYILFLNNDVELDKDCLKRLLEFAEVKEKLAFVQPKIILKKEPKKLDACGAFWTNTGFLYHFGYLEKESKKEYNRSFPVFSIKGAVFLAKRKIFERIGNFDEDFWNFYEETDLCHRAWLAGWESWYYPKAVAFHLLGATASRLPQNTIQFHNFKNKLLSFLKNFQIRTLLSFLPFYFLLTFGLSFYWLLKGKFKSFLSIYRAYLWNFKNLKNTLKKRSKVQKIRIKTDKEIFALVKKNPGVNYYLKLLKRA